MCKLSSRVRYRSAANKAHRNVFIKVKLSCDLSAYGKRDFNSRSNVSDKCWSQCERQKCSLFTGLFNPRLCLLQMC